MATQTPWGKSQVSKKICRGVTIHATAGHGGIMVAVGYAAKNLSLAARNRGELWGGYLCYEEDCAFAIVAWEMIKANPSNLALFYCDPENKKTPEEKINSFKRTLSSYYPGYLQAVGETPTEPEYTHWKEWQENQRLRETKSPNLIISALSVGDGMVKVWTADDKQHIVVAESYKQKTLNFLSDCTIVPSAAIKVILNHALENKTDMSESDKREITEYITQLEMAEAA